MAFSATGTRLVHLIIQLEDPNHYDDITNTGTVSVVLNLSLLALITLATITC